MIINEVDQDRKDKLAAAMARLSNQYDKKPAEPDPVKTAERDARIAAARKKREEEDKKKTPPDLDQIAKEWSKYKARPGD